MVAADVSLPLEVGPSNTQAQTNAAELSEPLGAFEFCCQLLLPLYAGRVTEEAEFGPGGASLMTSADLS